MELIPAEINMIGDFEAGMKTLENPSISQILFKWGALLFAILATFSSVVRRIKLIFIRLLHTVKPNINNNISILHQNIINDFNDEYDDDDLSLASSSDDEHEDNISEEDDDEEEEDMTEHDELDFCVKGSRRLWSEITSGTNHVVKLWDSLGLTLNFDEDLINHGSNDDVVSLWEREYSGGVWDIPSNIGKGHGVVLKGYDNRIRRRVPVLYGEWNSSTAEEVNGIRNGSKVYVRDEVNGVVTVGDVRNMRMPLGFVSDGETWWDADAVIVEN